MFDSRLESQWYHYLKTLGTCGLIKDLELQKEFTLTVNGSNFVSGAVVRWNGVPRTTTFVSATQVKAAIAAADIAAAGTANVSVIDAATGTQISACPSN